MRALALILLMATPAAAWEFTPGQPCVLSHQTGSLSITLTYDPARPLYTLALSRPEGFTPAPVFAMEFQRALPIRIATDRHQLSADGTTLSVADSGFGNVLNGLQFNAIARATLGAQQMDIPLVGAAEPVAAFRACDGPAPAV